MDRITDIIQQLRGLLSQLENELAITETLPDTTPQQPGIVPNTIDGNQAPWVLALRAYEGKNEVDDEAELTAWLGVNPNGNDFDGVSWCAAAVNAGLHDSGLPTTGSLRAADFAEYGNHCEEKNGAILVFQPDPSAQFPVSHVCVKVNDTKALGGNQGNALKESNLAWYKQNAKLVAVRCPTGFELA